MESRGNSSRMQGNDAVKSYKDKPIKKYENKRLCMYETCNTVLSIYNGNDYCWAHSADVLGVSPLKGLRG